MRAHHCADIERPKHRAYESCVIANLFLGRCLTFFRVELFVCGILKILGIQDSIRAIMSVTPSEFIWRITKFFAFSGTVPVNANITLWNAGCDAVKRRAKSCTNIFFTQILGHFKSPLRQPFSKTFCIRASHMRSRRLLLLMSISPATTIVHVKSAPYRRRPSACGVFCCFTGSLSFHDFIAVRLRSKFPW